MPLLISSILNIGYVYASSEVNTVNSSTPDEKTSPARIAFSKAIEMIQKFAIDESGNMKHPKEVVEECKKNSESGTWETKITPSFPVDPNDIDMETLEERHKFFRVDYIYYDSALYSTCRTVCLRYLSFIRPTTTGEVHNITGVVSIKQNINGLGGGDHFSYIFSSLKNGEELKSKWAECKVWANGVADRLLPKDK